MINKYIETANQAMKIVALFEGDKAPLNFVEKKLEITDFIDQNVAYVYMGKREEFCYDDLKKLIKKIVKANRKPYQIDLSTFQTEKYPIDKLLYEAFQILHYEQDKPYFVKTKDTTPQHQVDLLVSPNSNNEKAFKEASLLAKNVSFARRLQDTPPNIANSEWIAKEVMNEAKKYPLVRTTIHDRAFAIEHGMGLFLSVNKGSVYEPQIVVIEYNGDPSSNKKTAIVGKGITFDSGGYNLKPGRYMLGMKYDMSGAAIAAGTLFSLSELKVKHNVVAILMLTDNRINGDASLPDGIVSSMSGLTVEINNTDAEGRLVMADGITYAISKLDATEIIDIATLTGAALYALGNEYTATFAEDDQWMSLKDAMQISHEKLWRMPYHEDYLKDFKKSRLADLYNTDMSGNAGTAAAGMFLKQFSNGVPHLHLDIAGTADLKQSGTAATLTTLARYFDYRN